MKAFDAVIFDMDGVLVDSEPLHERSFLKIFHELGYGETHGIHFPDYYGRSDRQLWEEFVSRHRPPYPLEDLMRRKQQVLLELLRVRRPIFPGIPPLLEHLAPRCKLGLASGSPHLVINAVLELGNLRRFFPVTVSAQDVPRNKPAPDIFLRTAALLGVLPERCCAVEDAPAGVQAARAAGMSVVAITNSLPAKALSGATHIVGDYTQLRLWLESWRGGPSDQTSCH